MEIGRWCIEGPVCTAISHHASCISAVAASPSLHMYGTRSRVLNRRISHIFWPFTPSTSSQSQNPEGMRSQWTSNLSTVQSCSAGEQVAGVIIDAHCGCGFSPKSPRVPRLCQDILARHPNPHTSRKYLHPHTLHRQHPLSLR